MFRSVAVFLSLCFTMVLSEIALRVIGYERAFVNPRGGFNCGDAELGWVGVPDFEARFRSKEFDVRIASDPNGFRLMQSEVQPLPGAKTLMFLGDSFAWGWGVPQGSVFTDHLQNLLGPDYRVLNRAVNAYGTVQQMLVLERELKEGPVDVVCIMAFRNDFSDNLNEKRGRRPCATVENDTLVMTNYPPARPVGNWFKRLRRKSYMLTFVTYRLNELKARRYQRMVDEQVLPVGTGSVDEHAIRVMAAVLAGVRDRCQAAGAQLQVVYIPHPEEMTTDQESPASTTLKSTCAKLNIPYEDLLVPFRNAEAGPLYFERDMHWTPDGHRAAADVLSRLFAQ